MDLLSPLGGKDYAIAERRGLQPRQFQSAERNNDDWWRYSVRGEGEGERKRKTKRVRGGRGGRYGGGGEKEE